MKAKKKSLKKVSKKSESKPELNPFEIRINKQRHNVVGRKSKNDRGLPGVSRNRALKKRKETLLHEYVNRRKRNTFIDRRIGENDSTMHPDDKIAARLTRERLKSHKKSIFSLNDDEELTHLGQSIMDIDGKDDPRSDDEGDDDKLGSEFVEKAHFGGFLTKVEGGDDPKSRKEIIDELIAKSKQQKYERQSEKEANEVLTEKLDVDWKSVQSLITGSKAKDEISEKAKVDDYDMLLKELKFEPRAQASGRLKSEDEIAKEERKKLEALERSREARMRGDTGQKKKNVMPHRSADDLDDGFYWEEPVAVNDEEDLKDKIMGKDSDDLDDERGESKSDEDNSEENAEESDEGSDDDDDSYLDVQSDESRSDEDDNADSEESGEQPVISTIEHSDAITDDIPFVIKLPETIEEFAKLVRGKTAEEQSVIVERVIKCNHPSLSDGNARKLELFFVILLQYIHDLCSKENCSMDIVDKISVHVYGLVQLFPLSCAKFILDIISEKYESFQEMVSKKRTGKIPFPSLSTLIFFKLISLTYSTSDFVHMLSTPAVIFMCNILSECGLNTITDVLRGLFTVNMLYEYVSYSKRFIPEAINFLTNILYLITNECKNRRNSAQTSFSKLHLTVKEQVSETEDLHLKVRLLSQSEVQALDEVKAAAVHCALKLLKQFIEMYKILPSFPEMFSSALNACRTISLEYHPASTKSLHQEIMSSLTEKVNKSFLAPEKKPVMIKMLNPRFEEKFDGRKHFKGSKQKQEKDKLTHKYKKEMKGAMRELRRDNQFLAQQQLNEQMERDAERQRKLKELFRDLSQQEGEFKSLKRKK